METFVDIISDIGAQISKIKRCRINQQTLIISMSVPLFFLLFIKPCKENNKRIIKRMIIKT